ncbi:hypothetical protein B0H10DRAFT_2438106, partial [Mycena sp. CBHHK59/15]
RLFSICTLAFSVHRTKNSSLLHDITLRRRSTCDACTLPEDHPHRRTRRPQSVTQHRWHPLCRIAPRNL